MTEIGHNGTQNIHLHGIIWTDVDLSEVERIWKYGFVWKGKERVDGTLINYVNESTVGYITKYITKVDEVHTTYRGIVLTSAGIGSGYVKRMDSNSHKFKGKDTREYYRTRTGHKMAMPIYWRNKLWTDEEREQLWLHKLDKEERWVCGERVDISKGEEGYKRLLEWYRTINKRLGHVTGS